MVIRLASLAIRVCSQVFVVVVDLSFPPLLLHSNLSYFLKNDERISGITIISTNISALDLKR